MVSLPTYFGRFSSLEKPKMILIGEISRGKRYLPFRKMRLVCQRSDLGVLKCRFNLDLDVTKNYD